MLAVLHSSCCKLSNRQFILPTFQDFQVTSPPNLKTKFDKLLTHSMNVLHFTKQSSLIAISFRFIIYTVITATNGQS